MKRSHKAFELPFFLGLEERIKTFLLSLFPLTVEKTFDQARLVCVIATEKQPQILRLRRPQSTRPAPLRMTVIVK
jgi:hypothetical protein